MHFLHRHVWKLQKRIDAQVQRIHYHGQTGNLTENDVYLIERAVVQLQVEWEQFVRTFVLDCATGRFRDSSGWVTSKLSSKPANRENASHLLISFYPNRRMEPDWYLPSAAIDAAQRLSLSNFRNISATLGVTPWLLDDLRRLRNFIVHQSKRSALEMRSSGIVTATRRINPAESAVSYGIGGVMRFVGWSDFMKTVSNNLI